MSKTQIKRDIQMLKAHTVLAEPNWKKSSEKLQNLLRTQAELKAKLSPEQIREAVRQATESYRIEWERLNFDKLES